MIGNPNVDIEKRKQILLEKIIKGTIAVLVGEEAGGFLKRRLSSCNFEYKCSLCDNIISGGLTILLEDENREYELQRFHPIDSFCYKLAKDGKYPVKWYILFSPFQSL